MWYEYTQEFYNQYQGCRVTAVQAQQGVLEAMANFAPAMMRIMQRQGKVVSSQGLVGSHTHIQRSDASRYTVAYRSSSTGVV